MDEKRILLAFALTYLLIVAVRWLSPPPPPQPSPRPSVAAAPEKAPATPPGVPAATAPSATPAPPTASQPESAIQDEKERRVEVHTPVFDVAFTNRGARLLSWQLKAYKTVRGQAEEMAPSLKGGPSPLDIETGDTEIDQRLREGLFVPSTDTLSVAHGGTGELSFRFASGDLSAIRWFRFEGGYLVKVSASVKQAGREIDKKIIWGPGIGAASDGEASVQGYTPPVAVYLANERVERVPTEKLTAARNLGTVGFVGIESQYFAALFVPPSASSMARLAPYVAPAGAEGEAKRHPVAELDLGAVNQETKLFVGPKDRTLLAQIDPSLAQVVDIGDWLGPIVVPMISLLKWIHGWVGNYGWAIVVLTVGINLVMGPLRHMSIANGVKMAKLSPEMRVIQERYRKIPALDPKRQEMHKEIQALYARHGMSMSTQMTVGCLPLLLTLPFLFAIYRVLQVGVELRGAHFLWVPDLSQKDPYYIIPILMGLSMFVMQKMMPSAMDPAQQRIMMLMPIMFTVMFFAAPAGMNLYWLTSNVCSIIQQAITLRLVGGPSALVPAKASKGTAR